MIVSGVCIFGKIQEERNGRIGMDEKIE